MKNIKFSIITTTYNRMESGYLAYNINSIRTQESGSYEYEHIIIDDGSTDDTEEFMKVEVKGDSRLKYFKQKNSGPAKATKRGIEEANGDFVIIVDDDDALTKDSLKKRSEYIVANPGVDFFYAQAKFIDENNNIVDIDRYQSSYYDNFLYLRMLIHNRINAGTPTIRTKFIKEIEWPKWLERSQDYFLWLELLRPKKKINVGFMDKENVLYRVHGNMYSQGLVGSKMEEKKKLNRRIKKLHPIHYYFIAQLFLLMKRVVIFSRKTVKNSTPKLIRVFKNPSLLFKFVKSGGIQRKASGLFKKDGTESVSFDEIIKSIKVGNNGKKKVLVLMNWLNPGGAQKLVYNFSKGLNNDFEFTFVTIKESNNDWEEKFKEITDNIIHLPALFGSNKKKYEAFISYYLRKVGADVVHIIHSEVYYPMIPEMKAAAPKSLFINTIFNDYVDFFDQAKRYNKYIDIFLTDNRTLVDRFNKEVVNSKTECVYIGSGIDAINYYNPKKIKTVKDEGGITFSFIGRLSKEKGPDIFLNAAQKVLKSHQGIKFVIVGDGPEAEKLKSKNKDNSVEFLGYVSDVREAYKKSDVFVLPSLTEGFPQSLLEAMAMENNIIASDVGSVGHVLKDRDFAKMITPGSVDELVQAMKFMIENKDNLKRNGEKAREEVLKRYTVDKMLSEYEKLYNHRRS